MSLDAPNFSRPPSTEAIEVAAAAWLSLRDRGMSQDETTSFLRWLQQDPRHADIFGELDRTWANFDRLATARAAPPPPGAQPDSDLLAPRPRSGGHRTFVRASVAVAAAAVIVFGLLSLARNHAGRVTVATEVGAFRKLDLPDGSVVQLNTDSAIATDFTSADRRVRVTRGEVFFVVAKDPARPFVVTAGPIAVRAVGTAFNVRQRANTVEVLVTEGRVRVDDTRSNQSALPAAATTPTAGAVPEPPHLGAGERVLVSVDSGPARDVPAATTVERVTPTAVQRALAWQERRLEFDSASLADVAREFNRYNRQQLVIADATLATRHFSGTFRADGYESFVRLLEADFGVSVTHDGREIILRLRR